MRAGFNWEMGPFEMWDAAGVAETVSRMKALGLPVSAAAQKLLAASRTSWYTPGKDALLPAVDGADGRHSRDSRSRARGRFSPHARGGALAIPARRWSILATASGASSCIRSRTPSAATCSR